MAGKEGLVGKYRNFTEITRNIGIGVLGLALVAGWQGVATVAALSVIIDQGQLIVMDSFKKKEKAYA
jgi:hypothetical protein